MRLVTQRRGFDCGVAAVAMWCHVDYADAFYVAARLAGNGAHGIRDGLSGVQLQRIAARFARPLRRVHWRKVDLDEDAGILGINYRTGGSGHWVVLRRGTLIEPDPANLRIWDADIYLKRYRARLGMLLTDHER